MIFLEISSAAKVGMIAVLAIIVLGLIVAQVGPWKERDFGYDISVVFKEISGLQTQANVRLSGVDIGKVKSIIILPDHRVKINLIITYKGVNIYKDSIITVAGSLWGEKWVEIYPKKELKPGEVLPTPLPTITPGEVVEGTPPVSIESLITKGEEVLNDLQVAISSINEFAGDIKVQKNFKETLANFNTISKNVNQLVLGLQSDTHHIASKLSRFSDSLDRMAGTNEKDIREIVSNLKSTAHNLNLAVDTIKNIVTKQQFSDDILETLAYLRKTGEEISGIASDIHMLTSDPQIQADLKNAVHEANQTVHKTNILLGKVNKMIGADDSKENQKLINVEVENEWVKDTGISVPNLNLNLFPEGEFSLKAGADSIGHGTLYNLQAGKNYKNFKPRAGIVRSKLGLGVDGSFFNKMFTISLDAYDTQSTQVDLLGRINIVNDFYLLGGQRQIFDSNKRYTIFGVGKRF